MSALPPGVYIEVGTIADLRAMSRWHYRAGRPGPVVRVLVARRRVAGEDRNEHRNEHRDELLGVLAVSMPTLNGRWRARAFGGALGAPTTIEGSTGLDKRAAAIELNASVRCISRVVVDPRWRGCGLATALVRAYLRDPLTPCTESVAAMGAFSGFFVSAGMRAVELEPSPRDARLLAALSSAGIEAWRLAHARGAVAALSARQRRTLGARARTWARSSRATRRRAGEALHVLLALASRTLGVRQVAFVYETTPRDAVNEQHRGNDHERAQANAAGGVSTVGASAASIESIAVQRAAG